MIKLGTGPLGHATYQISNLYAIQFQRKLILKFPFFVNIFKIVIPRTAPVFTTGHHMKKLDGCPIEDATSKIPNLLLLEKKIFKDFAIFFSFCCHGNHSKGWNSILLTSLKELHPNNIPDKFHQDWPTS